MARDVEAEAGAADAAVECGVEAVELVEDAFLSRGGDADSVVGDVE